MWYGIAPTAGKLQNDLTHMAGRLVLTISYELGLGLKTSACYFFPMDLDWVSHKIVTETSGEEFQKDQSQRASTFTKLLPLASHLLISYWWKPLTCPRPKSRWEGKQTSFHGKRGSKHTSEGVSCQKNFWEQLLHSPSNPQSHFSPLSYQIHI